jgi:hypothetical protein
MYSLCPMNKSVPITAQGIIPVSNSDVANIPNIALSIPDFEGEAILRLFANSTQSEIGCYSAVVTNGATFSQPKAVGSVLGIFTFMAMLASFATAIYGEAVPTMRLHYAHSLSVGVVFSVWQHIYFTGALSVNWPSVLVAWWSNFAWASGMIYSSTMQSSINNLIGNNIGNTSSVGAAPAGSTQESLGGGYDISQIYKRSLGPSLRGLAKRTANHPLMRDMAAEIYGRDDNILLKRDIMQRDVERVLAARDRGGDSIASAATGYRWYGKPVGAGLPLPGNYSGFAGTLAEENIRASNAFMTGFLWFLILLVLLVAAVVAFKWTLEGLARVKLVKKDRLAFFRQHWIGYSAAVALRTCFIAWFMIMFLTIFQFTYDSAGGVKAVAATVFTLFLIGIPGIAAYACWYKIRIGNHESNPERFEWERKKLLKRIPWFGSKKTTSEATPQEPAEVENKTPAKPFWSRMASGMTLGSMPDSTQGEGTQGYNIHDDENFTMKFGWLAARFRRTRWWFFAYWLLYELLRACFYGGASGQALTQVFGLLVIETLAFAFVVWARPFEGRRLNILVVYCLGFSKVASIALSAAFDVQFNLPRIITTAIGIIIIVIQGILAIITLIAILVGCISSYMSISRNKEDFRPRRWAGMRDRYFDHLDRVVNDMPPEPKPKPVPVKPEEPGTPYFEVKTMRRERKIEDDDPDPIMAEQSMLNDPSMSHVSLGQYNDSRLSLSGRNRSASGAATPGRSRAPSVASMSQSNLPYGARPHRASWSQRDFSSAGLDRDAPIETAFSPVNMAQQILDDDPVVPLSAGKKRHSWTPSRSGTIQNQKLRKPVSNDSLRVGGDVSTRDNIGKVPAPVFRPRAGTGNSRAGSIRNSSGSFTASDVFAEGNDASMPGSHRASRAPMMTPALEADEYFSRDSGSGSQERQR